MPDAIFDHPRLAAVYDHLDGNRDDLEPYLAMAGEFGAERVLDLGCGTGVLALVLAGRGYRVVGVDPAGGSLDVARSKPGAAAVRWVHGVAADAVDERADLVMMTGNAAQAITDPSDWDATLAAVFRMLLPGGRFVFETRDPARRAWEAWTDERSRATRTVDGVGDVESWVEQTEVALPLVSFRWTFVFGSDGATLTSDSTLRFRSQQEVREQLMQHGFVVDEVRDAPDRPGREWVFVARRPDGPEL